MFFKPFFFGSMVPKHLTFLTFLTFQQFRAFFNIFKHFSSFERFFFFQNMLETAEMLKVVFFFLGGGGSMVPKTFNIFNISAVSSIF